MVQYCCVPHCTSRWRAGSDVKFHTFPKDQSLNQEWRVRIACDVGRRKTITSWSKVCSLHFYEDDYLVTSLGQWKLLKRDAVPTLYLPKQQMLNRKGTKGKKSSREVKDTQRCAQERIKLSRKMKTEVSQKIPKLEQEYVMSVSGVETGKVPEMFVNDAAKTVIFNCSVLRMDSTNDHTTLPPVKQEPPSQVENEVITPDPVWRADDDNLPVMIKQEPEDYIDGIKSAEYEEMDPRELVKVEMPQDCVNVNVKPIHVIELPSSILVKPTVFPNMLPHRNNNDDNRKRPNSDIFVDSKRKSTGPVVYNVPVITKQVGTMTVFTGAHFVSAFKENKQLRETIVNLKNQIAETEKNIADMRLEIDCLRRIEESDDDELPAT